MVVRREINRKTWDVFFDSKQLYERKKIKVGVSVWLMSCFIISAMLFCIVFSSYRSPLPLLNLQIKSGVHFELLRIMGVSSDCATCDDIVPMNHNDQTINDYSTSEDDDDRVPVNRNDQTIRVNEEEEELAVTCNFTDSRTDVCEINSAVRVHGSSSTIYIDPSSLRHSNLNKTRWTLRPYPRKTDHFAMNNVTEFTLLEYSCFIDGEKEDTVSPPPQCTVNHTVPAVLFSTGGYIGNHYHEFSEMILPLYLTAKHFNGQVQFLATNYRSWWAEKFVTPLKSLTNYPIIDVDRDPETHCFPTLIAGVKAHKEFGIDPSRTPPNHNYTMRTFSHFIRTAYSLPRHIATPLRRRSRKPRLLIISRDGSRVLLNQNEVAAMAKKVGFKVSIEGTGRNLGEYAKKVNWADVYLGVHGAGLTNMVFLSENAVMLQVLPLGLKWSAKTYYEMPAKAMGLRYLEYTISGEESNLERKYWGNAADGIFQEQGWEVYKKIVLDEQNVTVNVKRFRPTLLEALRLVYS